MKEKSWFAATIAIVCMIVYLGIRVFEAFALHISSITPVTVLTSILLVSGIFVLTAFFGDKNYISLIIPGFMFAVQTLSMYLDAHDSNYFRIYVICVIICGLYQRMNHMAIFYGVTSAVISILFILPDFTAAFPVSFIAQWLLAFVTLPLILLVSYTSSRNNYESTITSTYFDTLLESSPNLIIVLDELNRIVAISKSVAKFTGIEQREFTIGLPIMDLYNELSMKILIRQILAVDSFEETTEIKLEGQSYYFKVISGKMKNGGSIFGDPNTEINGRFIDMSDITDIYNAKYVAEKASEEAKAANISKSNFLAKMSHEIRTPMNAIIGMSELVLRTKLPSDVAENVSNVFQAGNNLLAIINDVLDFSKIESGKMQIIEVDYEMASMLNDVTNLIRARLSEPSIKLMTYFDSNLPRKVKGDQAKVRQILINILSNACKYTHEGKILFTVDAVPGDKDLNRRVRETRGIGEGGENGESESEPVLTTLRFTVEDTGIGIKENDLKELFTEFSRFNSKENKDIVGTGLGLAITKNLCESMGGTIEVKSEFGVGSKFTATITQEIVDPAHIATITDAEIKPTLVYGYKGEDISAVAYALEKLNTTYTLASNIAECENCILTKNFAYIITRIRFVDHIKAVLHKYGKKATVIAGARFGESDVSKKVCVVSEPLNVINIAAALNGIQEQRNTISGEVRFCAPTARVLIVDDVTVNLKVAEGLLMPYGMQIDTCTDGDTAILMVREKYYDIVLMDHMMPGRDGVETTNVIRANEDFDKSKRVVIIALTANAISGMREFFTENGFNDFLAKPIETRLLNATLEKWIPADKKKPFVKQQSKKEDTVADDFASIKGLNSEYGILTAGGSVSNYREVLSFFIKDVAKRIDSFTAIPDRADYAAFAASAHALKSALANIGANELSDMAKTLEFAGKGDDHIVVEQNLPLFYESLTELTKSIKEHLGISSDGQIESVSGAKPGRDELNNLIAALKDEDFLEADKLNQALLDNLAFDANTHSALGEIGDFILITEGEDAIKKAELLYNVFYGD